MTTNESMKFADLKDDVRDGYVWTRVGSDQGNQQLKGEDIIFAEDCPDGEMEDPKGQPFIARAAEWRNVRDMKELHNVYDKGLLANAVEAVLGK